MPSGVIRLRNSRKNHTMPRVGHEQRDLSGLRGTGYRHVTVDPNVGSGLAPKKSRPFKDYKYTDVPISAEQPTNGGVEGKKSARSSAHDRGQKG